MMPSGKERGTERCGKNAEKEASQAVRQTGRAMDRQTVTKNKTFKEKQPHSLSGFPSYWLLCEPIRVQRRSTSCGLWGASHVVCCMFLCYSVYVELGLSNVCILQTLFCKHWRHLHTCRCVCLLQIHMKYVFFVLSC